MGKPGLVESQKRRSLKRAVYGLKAKASGRVQKAKKHIPNEQRRSCKQRQGSETDDEGANPHCSFLAVKATTVFFSDVP